MTFSLPLPPDLEQRLTQAAEFQKLSIIEYALRLFDTNPKLSSQSQACNQWLQQLINLDRRVIIPEIADYEIRRELLRANKTRGLARLPTFRPLTVTHNY